MLLAIVVGAVILVGIVILVSPNAKAFNKRSKIPPVPFTSGIKTASIAVFTGGLSKARAALQRELLNQLPLNHQQPLLNFAK